MTADRRTRTRALLAARDVEGLLAGTDTAQATLRVLLSLTFDPDELIGWRAVEAIGKVAAALAQSDVEGVRRFLRRLLWLMNDESGGLGWRAPECVGEILVNVPDLVDEFGALLTGFYRQSPFERGAHLGVYRVARVRPAPFMESGHELAQSLDAPDPFVRGYAALALGAIGAVAHRSGIEALQPDRSPVIAYDFDAGLLRETTVGQMANHAAALLRPDGSD